MSALVAEKPIVLDIVHHQDNQNSEMDSSWMADMEPYEEEATDAILEYLIQAGARPHINASGDIIEIVTAITNTLNQSIPSHLSYPLKVLTDYIARWLCDYVENTNVESFKIAFGFDAKLTHEGDI